MLHDEVMKVLIVDGEPAIRRAVKAIVEHLGCQALATSDTARAAEFARRSLVDLAMIDLNVGGLEATVLCDRLQQTHPRCVRVLSGCDRERLLEAPRSVDLLLPKPYGMREVELLVRQAWRRVPTTRRLASTAA